MSLKTISLILAVVFAWGLNFVVIKAGVSAIEPLLLLGLRFTLAGLIFIPFMKWPGWKKARLMILVGILMGPLHQGTLYVALTYLPAGLMSIIIKSNIILVTLMGWFFLKEKIGWRTWLGIFVGLIGIVILFGGPSLDAPTAGIIIAFMSAFFISVTYIAQKKLDTVHPPTYIALMSLPVAPLILISSYFIEGTEWTQNLNTIDWKIIGGVLFYQAVILSITHMVWQQLVSEMPVSKLVPWTLLIPVFAITSAIAILGEELTIAMIIGGGLTISGVSIITFRRLGKPKDFKS